MTEGKKLDVVEPEKKPAITGLMQRLEQLNAELGYHKNSTNRIDEIRGYLHKVEIRGEDATRLAECLSWLKSVKQNVKLMAYKVDGEIKTINDQIETEKKNGGDHANGNKKEKN